MAKKKFTKPATTYAEQIKIWDDRHLQVPDGFRAQSYLSHISYYRLSAYCIPFQKVKDVFDDKTTFDDILNLYMFDRELRLIMYDAIERIEIGLRTQIIYKLSHKYGSHWHDEAGLFTPAYTNIRGKVVDPFESMQQFLRNEYNSDKPEVFIKHYFDTYNDPTTPPSWMAIELLTIGGLSRLYSNLADEKDKKMISDNYKLPFFVFQSWFHALTYLRNICAHHCRVWNREYHITPKYLLKPKYNWVDSPFQINNRTFYYLYVLKYFLNIINPNNTFKNKIEQLFIKYPNVEIEYMGIPTDADGNTLDWKSQALWK